MTGTSFKKLLPALLLSAALSAPVFAQSVSAPAADEVLRGSVAEVFGGQVLLSTPEGRILATLPEGVAAPAPGAWLELTGTRSGSTFAAKSATPTEAPANAAPALAASGAGDSALPEVLRGLGLRDVQTREDREDRETYIYARLPDLGAIRAEFRRDGSLSEVQSDQVGLPEALLERILPASVRAEPRLKELAALTEVDLDRDGDIEVKGRAADGLRIEMEFDRSGRLRDFERERDDRRSLGASEARERLTALGYTEILWIERGGRHVEALARNPHGDQVEVRLNERGEVERERLWTR